MRGVSEPARVVDVRAHVCPMTWVRVKLGLEAIREGEILEVWMRGDEPLRNLPRSAAGEGHEVVLCEPSESDHRLLIRKGG